MISVISSSRCKRNAQMPIINYLITSYDKGRNRRKDWRNDKLSRYIYTSRRFWKGRGVDPGFAMVKNGLVYLVARTLRFFGNFISKVLFYLMMECNWQFFLNAEFASNTNVNFTQKFS